MAYAAPNTTQKGLSTRLGRDPVAKSLGSQVIFGCGCLAALGVVSANPLEAALGAFVPAILFHLLWRTGETPTLLFCTLFQWLQAYLPTINANMRGVSLADEFGGGEQRLATWLSLLGVVVLALGIHVALIGQGSIGRELDRGIRQVDPRRLLAMYLAIWIVSVGVELVLFRLPSLRAPLSSLLLVKFVPIYLLAMRAFLTGTGIGLLSVPVILEIAQGMTGYFSSFRNIVFLLLVVAVGVYVRGSRIRWGRIALVFIPAVLLLGVWQGVKGEHRQFISGGARAQVVVVGFRERASNLVRLAAGLDAESLIDAFASGIERVGYVKHFGQCIKNVPSTIPHENGRLWFGAIEHIFMPRVLFPNKAAINDSERTAKYTMQRVSGVDEGTTISIGYMGESYIDFGLIGMFAPIFSLGFLYGQLYRWFVRYASNVLLGSACVSIIYLGSAMLLETSNIKIVGGVVTASLILAAILRFAGGIVWRWLCGRELNTPSRT